MEESANATPTAVAVAASNAVLQPERVRSIGAKYPG